VHRLDLLRRRIEVAEAVVDVNGRLVPHAEEPSDALGACARFLVDDLAAQLAGKAPAELAFTFLRGATLRVQSFRRSYFERASASAGLNGLMPHGCGTRPHRWRMGPVRT
jgi:hypothetical protein